MHRRLCGLPHSFKFHARFDSSADAFARTWTENDGNCATYASPVELRAFRVSRFIPSDSGSAVERCSFSATLIRRNVISSRSDLIMNFPFALNDEKFVCEHRWRSCENEICIAHARPTEWTQITQIQIVHDTNDEIAWCCHRCARCRTSIYSHCVSRAPRTQSVIANT